MCCVLVEELIIFGSNFFFYYLVELVRIENDGEIEKGIKIMFAKRK